MGHVIAGGVGESCRRVVAPVVRSCSAASDAVSGIGFRANGLAN
jgi:hypothetical protein